MKPKELDGRVALVTGAARGIGAATARLFADEGATVVLCDVREQEGRAVAATLPRATFLQLDVTDPAQWHGVVERTLAAHGRIDVLVNNAGIFKTAPVDETSLDLYMETVRVNQVGPFLGMQAVIPAMKAQRRGAIVNLSSVAAFRGNQNVIAYASTKWALRGMTKVAAVELGPYGIRVNSVHPGLTDTPMNHEEMGEARMRAIAKGIPLQRASDAAEVAQVILFLASDQSSYVTGSEHVCDGGFTAGEMRAKFEASAR